MIIPRKTNYKLVKRQRVRAAVHLHYWRKSYLGLHKTLGIFVKGIDIETGKYNWNDLATVGYGCIDRGVVVNMSDSKAYFLPKDGQLASHDSVTPFETMEILHIAGRCDFCGQCTDWPDDYCVSCKEEGFDKLHKKKKELEKDHLHV